jgi:hypothetical protein
LPNAATFVSRLRREGFPTIWRGSNIAVFAALASSMREQAAPNISFFQLEHAS